MKKLIIILLPLVILGVGAGLVLTGVIKIPGMGKKQAAANAQYKEAELGKAPDTKKEPPKQATKPAADTKNSPAAPQVTASSKTIVPEEGMDRLAELWDAVEPAKLREITASWKDEELAKILVRMDNGKVAALMAELDAKRASSLSRALQKEASIVEAEASG